jgi:hypothetical protein
LTQNGDPAKPSAVNFSKSSEANQENTGSHYIAQAMLKVPEPPVSAGKHELPSKGDERTLADWNLEFLMSILCKTNLPVTRYNPSDAGRSPPFELDAYD